MNCYNCVHFYKNFSECRRHPPVTSPNGRVSQPVINDPYNTWCSDYTTGIEELAEITPKKKAAPKKKASRKKHA